jgi:hypothetical protein
MRKTAKKVRLINPRKDQKGWALQESDLDGNYSEDEWEIYSGTLIFSVNNLRIRSSLTGEQSDERKKDISQSEYARLLLDSDKWSLKIAEEEFISGDLAPLKMGRWTSSEPPSFSLFGSSNKLNTFGLEVHRIGDEESEYAKITGYLETQVEANEYGPSETLEDALYASIYLHKNNFDAFHNNCLTFAEEGCRLSLSFAAGFYTPDRLSPSPYDLKILLADSLSPLTEDPHDVEIPEDADVLPIRAGFVRSFTFDFHRNIRAPKLASGFQHPSESIPLRPDQIHYLAEERLKYKSHEIEHQLISLCVDSAVREELSESHLEQRFEFISDLLYSIRYADRHPSGYQRIKEDNEEESLTIWKRRDPSKSMVGGYQSPHYFANSFDISELSQEYLKNKWLQSPELDVALLDILITSEICQYGEAVKRHSNGKNSLKQAARYSSNQGNLDKMKPSLSEAFELLFTKTVGWFIAPILFLGITFNYAPFGEKSESVGVILSIGYAIVLLLLITHKIVKAFSRLIALISGNPEPYSTTQNFDRWKSMYQVWSELEGPVVNPKNVRISMENAQRKGAIWDNAAYGIVDRAIASNPEGLIINTSYFELIKED